MAPLSNDTPATDLGTLGPVFCRDGARVHRHHKGLGLLHAGEKSLDLLNLGRKASVKADHQERRHAFCSG